MGSFYSTCSVSNMTLVNQKTSILLLSPGYTTEIGTTGMIVSNDGAQEFYSPFGFPIHGEYYDYGYINNIQRDRNVEMLEDFFGISIDDIIKNIGDDRDIPENIKNKEIFENLSMTYFRTEVLEYLQLGWDDINISNPGEYTMGGRISKLLKSLSKKIYYDDTRLLELSSKKDKTDSEREELYELMDLVNGSAIRENSYITSLSKLNMFKLLNITLDFKDDILKQYMFLTNLGFSLNKILLPSVYGSQDTNWLELYKFNNFVSELLIKDLKDYYCDEEEYDEINSIITSHERDKKINEILN
jgi:hypothetical protein